MDTYCTYLKYLLSWSNENTLLLMLFDEFLLLKKKIKKNKGIVKLPYLSCYSVILYQTILMQMLQSNETVTVPKTMKQK